MVIIRKLLSFFLLLVVITSLSLSVFASSTFTTPNGSNYYYTNSSGSSTNKADYWSATINTLNSLAGWFSNMRGTSFWYYNGTTTHGTANFFTALTYSLSYIGTTLKNLNNYWTSSAVSSVTTTLDSIENDTYDIRSSASSIKTNTDSIKSDISSVKSNTDNIKTNVSSIKTDTSNISSYSSSIKSNTDSIKASSSSIDDKMPYGYYAWVTNAGEGTAQANSTFTYWRATATSLTHMGIDIDDINEKMPTGYYAWMGATSATSSLNSTRSYWSAISGSLAYMGQDIEQMKNDIIDLHYMFASPEDLALKADQENNISAATSNFLSGSDSATSVGTGSIGKVKDLGDDAAAWFDTGVQATSLFDALSNDDTDDGPWMWFTQATMDDLDSTSNNRSFKGSSSPGEYVPDLYGAKMDELNRMLNAFSE